MKEDDNNYVSKVLSGDTQAFRVIVEKYQHMVFTICMQVLKSREQTEEAAQDAFIKAYRYLHQFEKRSSFKTWLYRIAYRSAIDYSRQNKKSISSSEEDHIVQQHADHGPSPLELLELENREKLIQQSIDMLKDDDALIVKLYYLEEKNIKEISGIMGLKESNVKIKLFRSRSKLREILSRSTENR